MSGPKIDLRPNTLDLELYAGDGVGISLTITDTAEDPLDVEGAVTAQIRANRLDASSLAEFTADLSIGSGIVVISLTGEQTAALIVDKPVFSGFWDVQWVKPGAEPITLMQGKVKCYADVTR